MQHLNVFITLISLILVFQTVSNYNVIASDLDNLCSRIESTYITNYHCHKILNQDSRSTTANYNELPTIAIDILTSNITNLRNSIAALLKIKSYNPKEEQVLKTCSSLYSKGEYMLKEAKYYSLAKAYKSAENAMKSYVASVIGPCEDEVRKSRGKVHPLIVAGSGTVVDISYAVVSILKAVGNLMGK